MVEKKDIEKLAALARMEIPESELEKVRKDIDTILAYVGQINEAHDLASAGDSTGRQKSMGNFEYNSGVKNIMREDGEPHEPGTFTDVLLKSAPKTQEGYVKVKKILQ